MGPVETFKEAARVVQALGNKEVYQRILDAEIQAMELVAENKDLKNQVAELQEQSRIKGELVFRDNSYWLPTDKNEDDGPFCSKCWDDEKKLIRLHRHEGWQPRCPACETYA